MAMTKEKFDQIIAKFGEENIIGFAFDNSGGVTFSKEMPFRLAEYIDPDLDLLRFIEIDKNNNPFVVLKDYEMIQSVMVKDPSIPIENYDRVTLRA